jgi:hypothetical protein
VNISAVLQRKVFGIPVMYLAALFVAVLVFFAWRMRDASSEETPATEPEGDPGSGGGTGGESFGGDSSGPLVTNLPVTPTTVVTDSNALWARRAIEWLYTVGGSTPELATRAITLYIEGSDLSYGQSALVDKANRQFGLPPEPITRGRTLSDQAGKTQGTPPIRHTVRSTSENSFAKLAKLYYGATHYDAVNLLEVANLSLDKTKTFPLGTQVIIPKYRNPKMFKATQSVRSAEAIGGRNGISAAAVREYNDALKFPVKPGTMVRVA